MLAKFIDDTYLAGLTNPTNTELTFKIIHIGFSNKENQTREKVIGMNVYHTVAEMQLSRSSCEKLPGTLHQLQVQEASKMEYV